MLRSVIMPNTCDTIQSWLYYDNATTHVSTSLANTILIKNLLR